VPVPGEHSFLVVGLGNPGAEYERSYHNLGFMVIDRLAEAHGVRVTRKECQALVGCGAIEGRRVMLAKPQTFMNLSGIAVKPLMEKNSLGVRDLILVYDDLDLPWTMVRVRPQGSGGGHHGVESVIHSLGTREFARVRLGIHPGHEVRDGAEFVLSSIRRGQIKELDEVVANGAAAVSSIISEGVEKSMARFNRRAQGSKTEEE
jgi:peptidyl-tRNA hydrolase, PTH1 family